MRQPVLNSPAFPTFVDPRERQRKERLNDRCSTPTQSRAKPEPLNVQGINLAMGVLSRYVTRELVAVFLLVFVLLVCVGLGGRFVSLLQEAAGGRYSTEALWWLIGLRIPTFVQLIAPFSIFLALVLTFGRLHADQEFVTLTSGGVAPRRVVGWLQWVLIPLALMVGFFSMQVTPGALKLLSEMALNESAVSEFDAIIPGTFRSFSKDARVAYVEEVDRGKHEVSGVFMSASGRIKDDTLSSRKRETGT